MKRLLLGLMLCALSAFAESADALKELSATHDFAFGGVGVAGITSKGEIAFRQVLASPSSEKDFLDLLATGNAQARCYALVALHVLDPKRYVERVPQFEHDQSKVSVIGGCMITEEPMYSVVTNISKGRYDLYLKSKER